MLFRPACECNNHSASLSFRAAHSKLQLCFPVSSKWQIYSQESIGVWWGGKKVCVRVCWLNTTIQCTIKILCTRKNTFTTYWIVKLIDCKIWTKFLMEIEKMACISSWLWLAATLYPWMCLSVPPRQSYCSTFFSYLCLLWGIDEVSPYLF